jgi:cytochrome c biogenesis protein CcmG, thiol:disulfide interchange protein DsbE
MQGMGRRLLAAICALGLLAAGCTADAESDPTPSVGGVPAVNAADAALLPSHVDELPDMDPAGFQDLLEQVRGTPLVVNVWAAWCAPCRVEAPELAKAAARYGSRIQFLGIDVLDNRTDARAFTREFGWTYPSVFDAAHAIPTSMGHSGQPVTLFYAADGTLMGAVDGQISAERLELGIQQLLG